jgi:hypothetical protein
MATLIRKGTTMKLPTEELDVPCYPICQQCGGQDVESKHEVSWDRKTQTWSVLGGSNYFYCYSRNECCTETDLYWIPINDLVGPPQQYAYTVNVAHVSNYVVRACSQEEADYIVGKHEKNRGLYFRDTTIEIKKRQ